MGRSWSPLMLLTVQYISRARAVRQPGWKQDNLCALKSHAVAFFEQCKGELVPSAGEQDFCNKGLMVVQELQAQRRYFKAHGDITPDHLFRWIHLGFAFSSDGDNGASLSDASLEDCMIIGEREASAAFGIGYAVLLATAAGKPEAQKQTRDKAVPALLSICQKLDHVFDCPCAGEDASTPGLGKFETYRRIISMWKTRYVPTGKGDDPQEKREVFARSGKKHSFYPHYWKKDEVSALRPSIPAEDRNNFDELEKALRNVELFAKIEDFITNTLKAMILSLVPGIPLAVTAVNVLFALLKKKLFGSVMPSNIWKLFQDIKIEVSEECSDYTIYGEAALPRKEHGKLAVVTKCQKLVHKVMKFKGFADTLFASWKETAEKTATETKHLLQKKMSGTTNRDEPLIRGPRTASSNNRDEQLLPSVSTGNQDVGESDAEATM